MTCAGEGGGGGGVEERKESGGEKAKSESRDCCINFKPENYLEILLSVHARTSELILWIIETEGHEVLHV